MLTQKHTLYAGTRTRARARARTRTYKSGGGGEVGAPDECGVALAPQHGQRQWYLHLPGALLSLGRWATSVLHSLVPRECSSSRFLSTS